jgi:hypothetical protein
VILVPCGSFALLLGRKTNGPVVWTDGSVPPSVPLLVVRLGLPQGQCLLDTLSFLFHVSLFGGQHQGQTVRVPVFRSPNSLQCNNLDR